MNEQTSRGGTALSWDKNGNLAEDDSGQVYFYDRANMLTRVEDGAGGLVAEYRYDALGRRIEASDGTDTTRFYWKGQQTLEETDHAATPNVQRAYVWGPTYLNKLLMMEDTIGNGGTAGGCGRA